MTQTFKGDVYGGQFANVINNYSTSYEFWDNHTTEELKQFIRKCKDNNRKAFWRIYASVPMLFCYLLLLCLIGMLGWQMYNFLTFGIYPPETLLPPQQINYLLVGIMFVLVLLSRFNQRKFKLDTEFRARNKRVIEHCEKIIHFRKYDQ